MLVRKFINKLTPLRLLMLVGIAPLLGVGMIPFSHSEDFKSQLKNWGLVNQTADSHIQATDAWKIEEGSKDVIVAVIDTGIDPTHPDLIGNLWKSKTNDHYGWNFVDNLPNPKDTHGHGTHIAGIIGGLSNPENGASGVAHKVSIMPVKYYSEKSSGAENLRNFIRSVRYAIDQGAQIINFSGGGPEFCEDEYQIIKEAESKGILFVTAAGNERHDSDQTEHHYFPSAYPLSNILSVAATDIHNRLLASSNWGKKNVDIGAPGEKILSTWPERKYHTMSGTSQATAFVAGTAALLLAQDPTLKAKDLKELILASADHFPHLQSKLLSGGRVNAYKALLSLKRKKSSQKGASLLSTTFSLPTTFLSPP